MTNLLNLSYLADDSIGGVFASFAPFLIVTIFMAFAAVQVLKTGAAGASAITGAAMKIGGAIKKQGKRLGLATQRWARNKGEKMAEGKGFLGRNLRYFTGKEGINEKEKTRFSTGLPGWFRKAPIIGAGPWSQATIWRRVGAELTEQQIKDFDERKKKVAGKSIERKSVELSEAITNTQKAAIMSQIQEEGETNDVSNMPKGDELQKVLESVIQSNSSALAKSLRFLDPAVTAKAVEKLGDKLTRAQRERAGVGFDEDKDGKDIEEYGTREGKILAKMKVQKMEYMDEDAAQRYVQKGGLGHVFWTGAHIAKGAELQGRKFIESFSKGMESEDWYKQYNPRLGKWIDGSAARNLGIGFGATPPLPPPISDSSTQPATDGGGGSTPSTGGRTLSADSTGERSGSSQQGKRQKGTPSTGGRTF
ncbi:MAG: hypothetical protein PHW31_00905 [Candidatus Pacebacteria bacterium]|nr:hypothetical protein [Candidatus Paceibacterota bacterium]